MVEIRLEQPGDIEAVRDINERAFGEPQEAEIVDSLRTTCKELLSLVAVLNDRLIGCILFSPVTLDTTHGKIVGMGLAPMAVLPRFQRNGVGSVLVKRGLKLLREQGCPYVIVLGHPEYYPRFGFVPASLKGLTCQWAGVPDESFMVKVFDEAVMPESGGEVRYMDEFDQTM